MRESKDEYPCKLKEISPGAAAVVSPVEVATGERIVAYFDHLGGIEGVVHRTFDGGFVIRFNITPHKREKIADQLTWLINKDEVSGALQRRHERIALSERTAPLQIAPGRLVECRLIDVSLSGASVETDERPPLGAEVLLGKLRCRVMRHHKRGIGVQFVDIQEPEALRKHFF